MGASLARRAAGGKEQRRVSRRTMPRWQPIAISAFALASVLVVAQSMSQGVGTVAPGPPPPPPRAGGAAGAGMAAGGAQGGARGDEPWAEEEAKLLGERTFSRAVSIPAPVLEVEGPDGRAARLAPEPGKAMLVSFWATWCAPCVTEMPSLLAFGEAVRAAYPGRFRLVAVSGDESWQAVNEFFARGPGGAAPAFLEQVRDPEGNAARSYYCAARGYCPDLRYPETYLVAPSGRIVAMMVGARNWAAPEARQLVDAVLEGG